MTQEPTPSMAHPDEVIQQSPVTEPKPSVWVGWIAFAGIMMVVVGLFQVVQGLTAIVNPSYLLVASSGLLVEVSVAAWGWVHLILGIVVVAAGFGVMLGQTWAQVVGIVLAVVSAVLNLAYIAAYPLWSIIIIATDVIIIHALAVHGDEPRSSRS